MHTYIQVDEYLESLDSYVTKGAVSGQTDRILPLWHVAKCQTALARFFVDSGRCVCIYICLYVCV
jgi:hypothetical protein